MKALIVIIVVTVTLLNIAEGWVEVYPSYGVEVLPAICEFGHDVPHSNWGVTNGELEPKGTETCAKFCHGTGSDCHGWKTTACTASLKYICQVPCKPNTYKFSPVQIIYAI